MKKKALFITFLILFTLANLAVPTYEAHFLWEKFPLFNVIFGFGGCVMIIVVSKALGKFLQKDEDYYD